MDNISLGELLRESTSPYRHGQKWLLERLNNRLVEIGEKPINKTTISQWCGDTSQPGDEKIPILADVLKRPVAELVAAKMESKRRATMKALKSLPPAKEPADGGSDHALAQLFAHLAPAAPIDKARCRALARQVSRFIERGQMRAAIVAILNHCGVR
jgi:hypothetical protein